MERKLYKYKSLKNFEHIVDIIFNNRFYASQYDKLNDPMEGLYNCKPGTMQKYLDDIKDKKKKLRICSFSEILKIRSFGYTMLVVSKEFV